MSVFKPKTVFKEKLCPECEILVYKKILEVLPEGRDDTTGPEKIDQAFLLRFAETTEIRIFYSYFFKKIICHQSSMQKFELKYKL